MHSGFRLGSLAGIEVRIDWSLIIIFALVTFSLGGGLFPAWHPDWTPLQHWLTALIAAVAFFASVLAHEMSHALVGRARGIEVRRITLFIFGGMAQMENEPRAWKAEFLMAIVGPVTSLVLGALFLLLAGMSIDAGQFDPSQPQRTFASLSPLPTMLVWLGNVNIILGLFNLVPGFPLDGGRVLRAALWGATGDMLKATRWASQGGQMFAWLLMFSGIAMMLGVRLPFFGTGFIPGLWLTFIGWFLNNAALMSYRQLLVRESLEDVPVKRLMDTRFDTVTPDMTVDRLVEEHLFGSEQRAFPVFRMDRFVGLVCMHDIRDTVRHAWPRLTVEEIMTPVDELVTIEPEEDATIAMGRLTQHTFNQLPVVDDGRLLGLISREDLLKWLSLYGGIDAEATSMGTLKQPR